MNQEPNNLFEYLSEIARRSNNGEIEWSQPNPSTFQWNDLNRPNPYLVTIQRAGSPKLRGLLSIQVTGELAESYLFQVNDKTTKQTVVSLSSKERPELEKSLAAIYRGAEAGMDRRASNVLRDLLERH